MDQTIKPWVQCLQEWNHTTKKKIIINKIKKIINQHWSYITACMFLVFICIGKKKKTYLILTQWYGASISRSNIFYNATEKRVRERRKTKFVFQFNTKLHFIISSWSNICSKTLLERFHWDVLIHIYINFPYYSNL